MSIYVVGSSKNMFPELDEGREKFIVDIPHEGDNIDRLNRWYCELTGLYHMWKNSGADYVGLEHYRRFFASIKNETRRMEIGEAQEILEHHDIIVTEYHHGPRYTALQWFKDSSRNRIRYVEYLRKFLEVLGEEDRVGFAEYLNRHSLIQCNMFIGKRPVVDQWCSYIFETLSRYDRVCPPSENNIRMDGYLAEHMFGYWLEKEKVPYYRVPKVEIEYVVRCGNGPVTTGPALSPTHR